MHKEQPIGLLDSGVGGLTIAGEVRRLLPGENIVYYGDNLHVPYGPRPQGEVRDFVIQIIEHLINRHNVKYVVIACNTATVAALEAAQQYFNIEIIGPVEEGAKKAVQDSRNQTIGIMATEGTVNSGVYQRAIHSLNPEAIVVPVPCPQLVTLIEAGQLSGQNVESAILECLNPILQAGCDSVVLGCTHFPFLQEEIRRLSEGRLDVIFPGTEIATKVEDYLHNHNLLNTEDLGVEICQTSDLKKISPGFLTVARPRLKMQLNFQEVNIF